MASFITMLRSLLPTLIMLPALAMAAPCPATFDSAGALTSLIAAGTALPVKGTLVAVFEGGVEVVLQPHDQGTPIKRQDYALSWKGTITCPNGIVIEYTAQWTLEPEVALTCTFAHPGERPVHLKAIEYLVDVPRATFVGGRLEPGGTSIAAVRPTDGVFFRGDAQQVKFTDTTGALRLELALDRERPVTVVDHRDQRTHSCRVRIGLNQGELSQTGGTFAARFRLDATTGDAPAVALTVDPANRLHAFDGFGANYCWGNEDAVTPFTLKHLRIAWSRHELKAQLWDREHNQPGPQLVEDFERIRGIQQAGVPWILSLWRLPERFYTDPNRVGAGTFARKIAGERWPELLELIGNYLLHLKNHYGAEPALFSFNEPDLGVNIGLTPTEHRDAVKRLGAHFASLGLKTRFLLGDTANPRDTHRYVLPTAADAEAMRHVGAISFHSWGGASPEQYRAWADVAAWLQLPLLVGEAGTDAGAYRNKTYDSYSYGLSEIEHTLEFLRLARPQASLYWEFSADYALVRVGPDGVAEPTGRFWLMKHLTNLTPHRSFGVASSSNRAAVQVGAFVREGEIVVHILNTGPACPAELAGLPAGRWHSVTTTEMAGFQETKLPESTPASIKLPARSLTTLVRAP